MTWKLYLDDLRTPPASEGWVICRSSREALETIRTLGMPYLLDLDHDLGGDDTAMKFLTILVNDIWNTDEPVPEYQIHSQNPVGILNIHAFMLSWKKSVCIQNK